MKSEYADQLKALLQELRQSKDPFKRWQAFVLDKDLAPSDAERRAAMLKILKDPNPVVRHRAMMYVWEPTKELMAALERVEREDPEPMNRALAAKIIRSANHK